MHFWEQEHAKRINKTEHAAFGNLWRLHAAPSVQLAELWWTLASTWSCCNVTRNMV